MSIYVFLVRVSGDLEANCFICKSKLLRNSFIVLVLKAYISICPVTYSDMHIILYIWTKEEAAYLGKREIFLKKNPFNIVLLRVLQKIEPIICTYNNVHIYNCICI
jgi:hypothetical protein